MRDGPGSVFNGVFTRGSIGGRRGGFGGVPKATGGVSNQAHASSILQARRMKSPQPYTSFYPRSCRENGPVSWDQLREMGSSPRIRGKRDSELKPHVFRRLIPAHTGNTVLVDSGRSYGPAHPRSCGENPMGTTPHTHDNGSSPAHTGNASVIAVRRWTRRAHPRAYGERLVASGTQTSPRSSPPRIRGTHITTRHEA